MYKATKWILTLATVYLIGVFSFQYMENSRATSNRRIEVFDTWNNCASRALLGINNHTEFWANFKTSVIKCDEIAKVSQIPIEMFKNRDEKKYGLLPVKETSDSPNVLVTLGIGNDIRAEEAFRDKMAENGHLVKFYGADPITDKNELLYSTIGLYFPLAVSGHSGFSTASVLKNGKYIKLNVVHLEIIYFINELLKMKTIDHLWMDAEYAEYELFDIFYKGGSFDQNSITFCQMSIEIHRANDEQKMQFMEFIKRLLADKRFGFFKTVKGGHIRLWLFNFENEYCVNKFIPSSLIS